MKRFTTLHYKWVRVRVRVRVRDRVRVRVRVRVSHRAGLPDRFYNPF